MNNSAYKYVKNKYKELREKWGTKERDSHNK